SDHARFLISARAAKSDESEISELVRFLVNVAGEDLAGTDGSAIVVNERHRSHLQQAVDALERAHAAIVTGAYGDALALDLRQALDEIGAITGAITSEDVLDQIFSRFCIGK
ncbi:MAG TPA: tRNA uridine-5-carboxymethylaminomethyl(34) synthesis GTPase MnmE, partial [Rhodothermales bacterium]